MMIFAQSDIDKQAITSPFAVDIGAAYFWDKKAHAIFNLLNY